MVKLADFGVAAKLTGAAEGDESLRQSVVGTPYWMAPEVIEMTSVTAAADIWSVGCLTIELLTGQPPYFDLQPMSALFRIVQVRTLSCEREPVGHGCDSWCMCSPNKNEQPALVELSQTAWRGSWWSASRKTRRGSATPGRCWTATSATSATQPLDQVCPSSAG